MSERATFQDLLSAEGEVPLDTLELWTQHQACEISNIALNSLKSLFGFKPEAQILINQHPGQVTLLSRDKGSKDVSTEEAASAYDEGWTIYLRRLDSTYPGIDLLLDGLASELGLDRTNLSCEAFMSTGFSGAEMHSDYDVNLAMLVSGKKTWKVAPMGGFANPPTVVLPSTRTQTNKMQRLLDKREVELPENIPDNFTQFIMEPGKALFLPRGWWHETYSEGDCLQINLVIKGPQFSSVLSEVIGEMLEADDEMREFVMGANSDRGANKIESSVRKALEKFTANDTDLVKTIVQAVIAKVKGDS